jgi:serine/threonine protein kinase
VTTLIDITGGRLPIVSTFYRVCEHLGGGRFAEVYKAFDTSTSTDVALKIYLQADEATHRLAQAERDTLQQLAALNTEYFPRLRKSLSHPKPQSPGYRDGARPARWYGRTGQDG